MSEELGKIEKPSAEEFKTGRKLYFVPLIFGSKELPVDYLELLNKYWQQVEDHISDLELKLGQVHKIYHELIPLAGKDGLKALKEINEKSHDIAKSRVGKGSQLEATEDVALLTEFMDWGRCLAVGLQNHKVLEKIYEAYTEVSKKRDEFISKHIDETLKADEIGILFMGEGYKIQFPSEVEVFYVSPPALDEIKRWLRNKEVQQANKDKGKAEKEVADS
ncbi:hypothetical protein ACFLWG_00150 [Chloroflexota bacterium]